MSNQKRNLERVPSASISTDHIIPENLIKAMTPEKDIHLGHYEKCTMT